jgi:hypothetical protein
MKSISEELLKTIYIHATALQEMNEASSSPHPAIGKWSKKEELGHLIDSAQNNLRRFIVSQYEHEPHIIYNQDKWISINSYNELPVLQLARLWLLLNQQIAHVLSNISEADAQLKCNTGKGKDEFHTIEWLAEDYLKHVRHHLHHILELEPVPY